MTQIEYTGIGRINNLGNILDEHKISKVFLITGKNFFSECGAETYINQLKSIKFVHFNDFEINPKIEDVNNGLQLFRQSEADAIIVIGGGSAIDIAKSIRFFFMRNIDKISIDDIKNDHSDNSKNQPLLIAIPTTAGSGSEATSFAVMYCNKIKYSIADHSLLPDFVILDPNLSMSLSSFNTAVTGMDALCQAIESYWSINSTEESKEYARNALTIVLDNLPGTVNNPSLQLRLNMIKAANLSGKAINISKTTAAHAISYALTSNFAIPHGLAVSLILPELLVFNDNVNDNDAVDPRGVNYIKRTLSEIYHLLQVKSGVDAQNFVEQFMNKIGLSTKFSFYGIKINDIDLILSGVNNERLNNNPRRLGIDSIKSILESRINNEKAEIIGKVINA